jgi:cobaltochelatase CobS
LIYFDNSKSRQKRGCRICAIRWSIVKDPNAKERRTHIVTAIKLPGTSVEEETEPERTIEEPATSREVTNELVQIFEDKLTELSKETLASVHAESIATAQRVAKETIEEATPRAVTLVAPVRKKVEIKGRRHAQYDEVVEMLAAINQVMLVGPAGSGKSSLGNQIAEDFGLDFGFVSCTEGLSEAHILGRMNIQGAYIPAECVRICEEGGVMLFDEVDAMDANTSLVINELLANGRLAVPNRPEDPIAIRSPECLVMCAGNTFGSGSDMQYVGRNQLDAAFLDRFSSLIVEVGYDKDLETELATQFKTLPLLAAIWRIRENVEKHKVRRAVTTRWVVHTGKLHQVNEEKYNYKELIFRCMKGWTDEEVRKALEGVDLETLDRGFATVQEPKKKEAPKKEEEGEGKLAAPGKAAGPICSQCDVPMVRRIAKRGKRRGSAFWGCANYPRCKNTVNIA